MQEDRRPTNKGRRATSKEHAVGDAAETVRRPGDTFGDGSE